MTGACTLRGAAAAVALVLCGAACCIHADWRNLENGRLMYTDGYMDQPYCAVIDAVKDSNALSRWVCIVTLNPNHEGADGEQVASFFSENQGRNWEGPYYLHPDYFKNGTDTSYGTIVAGHNDTLYAITTANLDDIHKLPSGKNATRVDELGYFLMVYSVDGGETWQHDNASYILHPRTTAIDSGNDFEGAVQLFWNVDQIKSVNGTAYFMYTKIGSYVQNPPQEGFVFASDNVLNATDPSNVTWSLRPAGDHGPGAPFGYDKNTTVAEEWHVLPMATGNGFYAIFRTNLGFLGSSSSYDATAESGWRNSSYAAYAYTLIPGGGPNATALKNPRGPITLKRFSNGKILLLFYNNGCNGYNGCTGDVNSRNPYWLAAGWEDGTSVVFSQPEIVLYIPNNNVTRGPGYPDFIEDRDGSIWISETEKVSTRVHLINSTMLDLLWRQDTISNLTTDGLVTTGGSTHHNIRCNELLPDFTQSKDKNVLGVTMDFVVPSFPIGNTSNVFSSEHLNLNWTGQELTLSMSNFTFTTDSICSQALTLPGDHFVAFTLDGGPFIATFFVDGKLCDGGLTRQFGWSWFDKTIVDLTSTTCEIDSKVALMHGYARALLTTELVANYRAVV